MGEKARIAVIGAGWWATEYHIPHLKKHANVDVVGVSRLGAGELHFVKERFDIPVASQDFREMLEKARPDGAVIASPHVAHYENAVAALAVGAHVLVEKPMTTSTKDGRDLVARAVQAGRQVMIPHGYNFNRYMPRAAAWIAEGRIGEVRHVVCQMGSALLDLFGGKPMLETEAHTFRPPPSTWADPARAGGYGWGQLSHLLGALFRLTPLEPAEVFAVTGKSPTGVDYFDAATVEFRNGATGVLSGSAAPPKHMGTHIDLRIYGTEGCVLLDVERPRLELRRHDGADEAYAFAPGETNYSTQGPIERFVDICLGKAVVNEADGTVGLRSVEVLDALYRSAESGRPEAV